MAPVDSATLQELKDIANRLRINSIKATDASKSGHPTSCASAAELMSVLFFHTMKYKVSAPRDPASDRFVMSKGHACPVLYAAWAEAGLFPYSELLNLRKIDSDLEGHPTPVRAQGVNFLDKKLNFIDVATGSLGQGLSCAAGMAIVGKYIDKASYRVFCMMGDGESAEGSVWEAMSFAGHYKLDNLVAIFDVNRLGQSEPTAFQHDMELYQKRAESFGWNTYVVDGHDIAKLVEVFHAAEACKGRPTCIMAKTFKGKGFIGIEDELNWHGKPLGDKSASVIAEISKLIKSDGPTNLAIPSPANDVPVADISNINLSEPPNYKPGESVATRLAYGTALAKIGKNNARVIAMDGDTKNSTYADKFKNAFPDRYFECFIAEQNLVGVAIGAGTRCRTVPFVSTFAAFFSRAYDQLRMGAVSQANIKLVGSHAGCSIGEDGPSQMALEDIAMFRAIPDCTVFYPCDAVETERAVELAANIHGICFIRTSRPNTAVLFKNNEPFRVGKAKIVRQSGDDKVLVIGAGVTVHEALKAADQLQKAGINIRVLDPFTIKPLDNEAIIQNARETGGRIITVEDHYPEGGLGEAVLSAVALEKGIIVKKLAVPRIPRSGPPDVLLDMFGINHRAIVEAVQEVLKA